MGTHDTPRHSQRCGQYNSDFSLPLGLVYPPNICMRLVLISIIASSMRQLTLTVLLVDLHLSQKLCQLCNMIQPRI